jgi:hypothetical protein
MLQQPEDLRAMKHVRLSSVDEYRIDTQKVNLEVTGFKTNIQSRILKSFLSSKLLQFMSVLLETF